jgi:hypothetical protein
VKETVVRTNRASKTIAIALALLVARSASQAAGEQGTRLEQVLDRIVENEREVAALLERHKPLVETYLQTVKPDTTLGTVPVRDAYFLGRLALPDTAAAPEKKTKKKGGKTLRLLEDFHSATFKPEAFARMLTLDRGSFDRQNYAFELVRTEFLGEVRTLVFDVVPKDGEALRKKNTARFTGRVWVEDRDYHVVRYNGVYESPLVVNFHFDSWRLNMAEGVWLPAYVYTEEAERASRQVELVHKGQTRIWGYAMGRPDEAEEFTQVRIDAPNTSDTVDNPGQISPLESARLWESEAEENVLRRLERAGLLAPAGGVDRVLETVVSNLEITNGLDIRPPVRCRVLLTTPLESFTIGHTIVMSRGLIDVLPDEASLAMVLAHELGHVVSGHRLDTRFAFSDQVLLGDRETMERFGFQRDPAEELEADRKAVELLAKSPYKDALATPGLFLKELQAQADALPYLIKPHFGSQMLAPEERLFRMQPIVDAAPALEPTSVTQIAALPLGGRILVDPWSGGVQLLKNNRLVLLSAREKMPLQLTPLMPYLARYGTRKDVAQIPEGEAAGAGSR